MCQHDVKTASYVSSGIFFVLNFLSTKNIFIFFWKLCKTFSANFLCRCVENAFYVSSGTILLSIFWIGMLVSLKKIQPGATSDSFMTFEREVLDILA